MTTALLRLEGAALFVAALTGYWISGASWWLFALLILVPDLSMLGYLRGPRIGAYAYNCFHVTLWPLLLLVGGYLADSAPAVSVGLIWLAHIGIDRALGYGLKLPTDFRDTHLGRIGRG
jgi:hypothetical protein